MNKVNFALKIRKFYLISILAVLTASFLNAQQSSFSNGNQIFSLTRYTFPNHLGIEKVYSISQNNLGIIFFSTNKGIITFDGLNWGVVNYNQPSVLSLVDNKLLLFSRNFTGQIEKDAAGSYFLYEIKTSYPLKSWHPADVALASDSVFLLAGKKLWLFHRNTFKEIADSMVEASLFTKSGSVYVRTDKSVFKITEGELNVTHALPNDEFFFLNGTKSFSVLTNNNELFLDNNGNRIITPIKDAIVKAYPDKNNNIWLISEKALYCIKFTDYFSLLRNIPLINDAIIGIVKNTNVYYFASSNHVFYPPGNIYKVRGVTIKNIFSLGNNIIISGISGIFLFNEGNITPLVSRPISYITKNRDKLYFISKGFLYSLRLSNGTASVKEIFNLKTDSISKISFDENGDMLFLDRKSKILQLKSKDNGFSLDILYMGENDNSPVLDNVFRIGGEVFVCNAFNVFKLQGNSLINQEKSRMNFPSQGHFIEYLSEDTTGGILYATAKPGEKKHIYYGKHISGSQINWLEIPVWEAGLNNPSILNCSGNEVVFFEDGKLIQLNLDKFFGRIEKLIITTHEILVDNQQIQFQYRKRGGEIVPYFEVRRPVNLISLKFYASDLTYPDHVRYSFLLMDEDAKWSDWTSLPERNFSNLPPGEYKLLVKAQTLNGSVSDPFTLRFRILSPVYLHWYAWLFYLVVFVGLIGLIGFRRKRQFNKEKVKLERIIQDRTSELIREKEKTDKLIANMLPKDTADEIKSTGKATSHKFDMVTVLFSDIQGFTKIAEQMNPEKLIDELDNFFFQFDSVVEKYNIEKIKTIGDAYMAAGGIPYKNRTNPVEVVLAALEMQEYMRNLKRKNTDIWDLRIGIHTGAVIAGVIGHKRISYDIWGDTVNTASRMESSGEAGKINISGQTYELVKEFFICEYRGKMPVKYKGDIDMYFVKGIRPELSVNLRTIPNRKFFVQLQLLRLHDLEEFVFDKLEAQLPKQLPFHNLKHTKDVYTQVELLGRAENVTQEEMLLLRTAALFHDTGFMWVYHNHESKSIEFCREILPKFRYSREQIELICDLISYTRFNAEPKSKLERIMIDANTDYYGRIDFMPMILNLARELKMNYSRSEEEMLLEQLIFIENHEYYTTTARKLREVPKHDQIKKVKAYLKIE